MAMRSTQGGGHATGAVLRWIGPFTGFYRPDGEEMRRLDPVSGFLYAARSVILVISAQAALVAGLVAVRDRRFNLAAFVLVLVGFVALHMISNLSNDYFGLRRGHDTADSPRMRYTVHPFAHGPVTSGPLRTGVAILGGLVLAIGAYFVATRGWPALAFAAVGLALLFLYDASPVPLKAIGLGETAAFIVWGPLMIGGGYAMITGRVAGDAFLASLPYGLGVMSILIGKHIDQMAFDAGAGNRTLPVVLGEDRARVLNRAVVVAMYGVTAALIAVGALTPFAGLVGLALPRAWGAVSLLGTVRPSDPPAGYVGWPLWYHRACLVHNRMFGWLYILGLALGAALPGVRL